MTNRMPKAVGKVLFAKLDPFFFGNRKIVRAGRNGRDVFLFALCVNVQRGGRGHIPSADLEPWYIAHQLGIPESDAADGVTKAVTAGLLRIDGETVSILGWNDDWSRYPQSRAEIQKNYRERHKKEKDDNEERYQESVTSDHQGNALPIREEKRREERESAVTRTDSLSLPGDFAPSQKARKIAADRRLDLVFESAQFRDHAESAGWTSENWDASFCKWLRNSKDSGRKPERAMGARNAKRSYVSRQRTAAGTTCVLHEPDGSMRTISDEEAKEYEGHGSPASSFRSAQAEAGGKP